MLKSNIFSLSEQLIFRKERNAKLWRKRKFSVNYKCGPSDRVPRNTDDFLGVTLLLLVAQKATRQVCQTAFSLERSALCKRCTHTHMHTHTVIIWMEWSTTLLSPDVTVRAAGRGNINTLQFGWDVWSRAAPQLMQERMCPFSRKHMVKVCKRAPGASYWLENRLSIQKDTNLPNLFHPES